MAVEKLHPEKSAPQPRPRSELGFPSYNLADSLQVADLIHKRGGGVASPEHLSTYLGYKSTNNGAYLARVGAARTFGLITKNGANFVATPLALQILTPVYDVDVKKSLVDAFFNAQLFKRIYEDFKGKELPPEFGMKNALRHQYGVVPKRLDVAYRMLMESAETAGFFETRNGAKTHLILPAFPSIGTATPGRPLDDAVPHSNSGGGGGGGDNGAGETSEGRTIGAPNIKGTARTGQSMQLADVKAKYLQALIKLFEEKSAGGELDEKLMERIERLIDHA